jgi:hypothetical protein
MHNVPWLHGRTVMPDRLAEFSIDSTKTGPHFPQRASRATCEYAVLLSLAFRKIWHRYIHIPTF